MKTIALFLLFNITGGSYLYSQPNTPTDQQQKAISFLIDQYSEARDKSDTILLKSILTTDVDQLVSSGEWRKGIGAAVQGMVKSSANRQGAKATLKIESVRMLNADAAVVDCRYETPNTDGTMRKMWSSFIVISEKKIWKISAIRNMLPA